MDKLRALHYFIAAAEAGSFAGAARRLEISVPSVHKLIGALERELGVALFERNARGLTLTASGQLYLESGAPLLAELAALDQLLTRSASRATGTLVIGVHPQLAHHFVLPALARFRAECPEVQIDIRVIHRSDEPDAAMVDVFVLHGWPEAPDLVHKRLGLARSLIVATPDYWARLGVPRLPADLARHNALLMRNPAGIVLDLWEFERAGQRAAVTMGGWLNSNDREVILDALLASEGVGRVNALTTGHLVQQGRLVPVLTDWEVLGGPPLNLLYRPQQRQVPRVRRFVDFITALAEDAEAAFQSAAEGALPERPHWHRRGYGRASSVLGRRR